jgi:hypothetical protein
MFVVCRNRTELYKSVVDASYLEEMDGKRVATLIP